MKNLSALFCALAFAGVAAAAEVALLSVATDETTLDLAYPAAQRPAVAPRPLPHSEEFILRLSGAAQARALAENRRVAEENDRLAAVTLQADRDRRARREAEARHVLSQSDFGRAVARAPEFFSGAVAAGTGMSEAHADGDGFVEAGGDGRFIRLLFGAPRFNPAPAPLPNISDEPIRVTVEVMLKVESPAGGTVSFETFPQALTAPNSDALLGTARGVFFERLVQSGVEAALGRIGRQP